MEIYSALGQRSPSSLPPSHSLRSRAAASLSRPRCPAAQPPCSLRLSPGRQHSRPRAVSASAQRQRGGFGSGGNSSSGYPPDPYDEQEIAEEEALLLASDLPAGRKLESEKIPKEVRVKVENAVERLQGRATVGDVSSVAGITIYEAESALNAIAADVQGTLKVSEAGDVIYELPRNFKASLRARSTLLRLEPAFEKAQGVANYLVRVLFGGTLFVSIAAVTAAIAILLTAASSQGSDRDERRNGRGGGVGINFFSFGPRPMFGGYYGNPFYWADPWYYQRPRVRLAASRQEKPQGILEGIFSFVFGDGNPNALREARKWQKVGQYITSRGGVVTAEELAPFLEPSTKQLEEGDEGYVVPALVRFDGVSEVSPSGQLLYSFPSLQRTASQEKGNWSLPFLGKSSPASALPEADLEQRWKLSNVDGGTKALAVGLGLFNVAAVAYLTSLLGQPGAASVLFQAGAGWIVQIFPALQLYAASFFAIPLLRSLQISRQNAAIQERNEARRMALQRLALPSSTLSLKLQEAGKQAQRVVVSDRDVVYSSDKPVGASTEQFEAEEWEARLRQREGRQAEPSFEERLDRVSKRERQY